jgi:two-component system CheB/CheR fusion protein
MENNGISADSRLFPIVGIGASAGGLIALEQFLSHVPVDCGMAFVVVQHLDPHREGMLVELLRRRTHMPVEEVSDQMALMPNQVYVIPPGRDLAIEQGVLHLQEPPEPRGLRLPIDSFFKSLADDRQQNSIGVILSGMGADGTLGLRAIREAAGACFVQTPATAQFDSMPRSAIDAGVADVVAPAEELPAKIAAYVARIQLGAYAETEAEAEQKDAGLLDKIIGLLHAQTGHDFSQYKKSTISRRVERRMGLHQLARLSDYLRYLRENPSESELLFNELLIGVTSFFRDPEVWDKLKTEVIPALITDHPDGAVLRAWTPGCSTGEEAYSLAMVFKEALEDANPTQRYSLQIFASDLDKAAIATGRAGLYARSIEAEVSPKRLSRFFVDDPGGFRVCNEIREMVIFAEQNIIVDPPFTKLHLLSCRNLLIYLEPELQDKLIQLFHYSLGLGGFLVLGSAESIGSASALFTPLSGKTRIYRRLDAPVRALPVDFPAAFVRSVSRPGGGVPLVRNDLMTGPNLQLLVEKVLLDQYAPAALLVTHEGDVLYFSGKTGKYLEPATGKPNLNLFAMSRTGLDQALSEAFHRAMREQTLIHLRNIKVTHDGGVQYVHVVVQPLGEPSGLRGMALVVFEDVAAPRKRKPVGPVDERAADSARLEAMVQELQQSREEAKSTREEMQTTQEELKSTNEELQSSNEELQSTNEELTTSKEEMQSMNEELQTVNHELQAKVTELSRASNDMKNLLESTEIAILFLDESLNVRRFTVPTTRIISLIPADMGRPITDIVTQLQYPHLAEDAREVMRSLVFKECDVPTTGERWFRVRIMPYRTQENRIDGLVITFVDITVSKMLEAELLAARAQVAVLTTAGHAKGVVDGLP